MRTMRKDAPLLTLEEPILVDKLQRIFHKRSPQTLQLGSAGKKVDPRRTMRKSVNPVEVANVTN